MANQQTISLLRDLRAYFAQKEELAEATMEDERQVYNDDDPATDEFKEAEDAAYISASYVRQLDAALAEETAEDEDDSTLVDDYDLMSDAERMAQLHEILNGE